MVPICPAEHVVYWISVQYTCVCFRLTHVPVYHAPCVMLDDNYTGITVLGLISFLSSVRLQVMQSTTMLEPSGTWLCSSTAFELLHGLYSGFRTGIALL